MAIALLAAAPALAADDRDCRGVDESSAAQTIRTGRVIGAAPRVNFVANSGDGLKTGNCPSANAACRRNAFVVLGDSVLVDRVEGAYACATFVSPRGASTVGWLPAAQLVLATPAPAPKPGDWVGKWSRTEAEITIAAKGADLQVGGNATYGAKDPERVRRGAVNIGEFGGKARPKGNMLAVGEGYDGAKAPDADADSDCRVRLRLFEQFLVVEDNRACGGHNVSFTGVYARQTK